MITGNNPAPPQITPVQIEKLAQDYLFAIENGGTLQILDARNPYDKALGDPRVILSLLARLDLATKVVEGILGPPDNNLDGMNTPLEYK